MALAQSFHTLSPWFYGRRVQILLSSMAECGFIIFCWCNLSLNYTGAFWYHFFFSFHNSGDEVHRDITGILFGPYCWMGFIIDDDGKTISPRG